MSGIHRRGLLKSLPVYGLMAASPFTKHAIGAEDVGDEPFKRTGTVRPDPEDMNPLEAKIVAFTTVSPDVDASIAFYRDLIGMTLHSDETLAQPYTTAPGRGDKSRRHALLHMPDYQKSAAIRVLQAPAGAKPNRPRPGSTPTDLGIMTMEGGTRDAALSFHLMKSAGVETLTTPRYWYFTSQPTDRDPPRRVHYMTFAAFGPGGEQMFISGNIGDDRPERDFPGLHGGFYTTTITTLDSEPAGKFYEQALGMPFIKGQTLFQRNANELTGAPPGTRLQWNNVGRGLNMEIWDVSAKEGTVYPTSLARTGLAMITVRVNDLDRCAAMCREAGIEPVGEGAFPLPNNPSPEGFALRGAMGELVEIIQA